MFFFLLRINTRRALFIAFKRPLLLGALMMIIYLGLLCLGSFYFLSELLKWAGDRSPDRPAWRGWVFATALVLNTIGSTFAIQLNFYYALKAGVQMRGAVMAAVFRKATRISAIKSVGQVVNLVSNDVQRLVEMCQWFNFGWGGPGALVGMEEIIYVVIRILFHDHIEFICSYNHSVVTVLAVLQIGWPAIPGLLLIVMLFAAQYFVGKQTQQIRRKGIQVTDRRVRHMSEILTSIKMIKLYAWETSFASSVADIRDEEIGYIRTGKYEVACFI